MDRLCVHAIRDIEEGEELCISYRAPDLIFEHPDTRSMELRRLYGFKCGCPTCTIYLDSENDHRSRSERIAQLMHQIAVLTEVDGTVSVEAEKLLDEAPDLMEDEGLETLEKSNSHEQLAGVCKRQGRWKYNDAVYHLWHAKNIAETCLGGDHEEAKSVRKAYDEMILRN